MSESTAPKDTSLVSTTHSPNAALKSVGLRCVQWTDGFWATRLEQAREVTLPHLWKRLADADAGHVLQNLRIAAGQAEGEFGGVFWADAWMGKWLEAAAVFCAVTRDDGLNDQMDEEIALLAKVQQPDGYLASQTQADGEERFQDPIRHELYTMGHLITAAVIHHRVTGKTSLLGIARKMGDYIHKLYSGDVPRRMVRFPFNPSIIMALVELYRETHDRKYLDAARGFVDRRGSAPKKWGERELHDWMGGDHCQDRVPLREEHEMVGHSVLSTYLYCGAMDVYLETGEKALLDALKRIWRNHTERKMFIHGGACALTNGLSIRGDYGKPGHHSDPVHEAAGPEYFLPNALSYNETCSQVGVFMWAWRMLAAEPDPVYADVMEQTLYAAILAGIGLEGASWFYRNVLRWHGGEEGPYTHKDKRYRCVRFQPGPRAICCPTNVLRLFAEYHSYLYTTSDKGLWVHHYAANTLDTALPGRGAIQLTQETDYPWDGDIKLIIAGAPPDEMSVLLRIPHWVERATLKVNRADVGMSVQPGTYAEVRRVWAPGDVVELHLPMTARLMAAHPLVEECRNQVAVMRGPVVYCLEGHDLPDGMPLHEIHLPRDIQLTARHEPDLLNGVTVLEGEASRIPQGNWQGQLYKPLATSMEPVPIRLIPYFAWANRGPAAMSIWLPVC